VLHQWESENQNGYLQARFLVRQKPFLGLFFARPRERIVVLTRHVLRGYHPTKVLRAGQADFSVDLFNANIMFEPKKKDLTWKIREGTYDHLLS